MDMVYTGYIQLVARAERGDERGANAIMDTMRSDDAFSAVKAPGAVY